MYTERLDGRDVAFNRSGQLVEMRSDEAKEFLIAQTNRIAKYCFPITLFTVTGGQDGTLNGPLAHHGMGVAVRTPERLFAVSAAHVFEKYRSLRTAEQYGRFNAYAKVRGGELVHWGERLIDWSPSAEHAIHDLGKTSGTWHDLVTFEVTEADLESWEVEPYQTDIWPPPHDAQEEDSTIAVGYPSTTIYTEGDDRVRMRWVRLGLMNLQIGARAFRVEIPIKKVPRLDAVGGMWERLPFDQWGGMSGSGLFTLDDPPKLLGIFVEEPALSSGGYAAGQGHLEPELVIPREDLKCFSLVARSLGVIDASGSIDDGIAWGYIKHREKARVAEFMINAGYRLLNGHVVNDGREFKITGQRGPHLVTIYLNRATYCESRKRETR